MTFVTAAALASVAFIATPAFATQPQSGSISLTDTVPETTMHSGDWVSAGYTFSIPSQGVNTTVGFNNPTVTIPLSCSPGGTTVSTLTISLGSPAAPYGVNPYVITSAAYGNNVPYNQTTGVSAANGSYGDYQGASQVPAVCGSGSVYASADTFTSSPVQWTVAAGPHLQFNWHVTDQAAAAGWTSGSNVNCSSPTANPGSGTCSTSWSANVPVDPAVVSGTPLPSAGPLGLIALSVLLGGTLIAMTVFAKRRRANASQR
jgi:hypothetical protein